MTSFCTERQRQEMDAYEQWYERSFGYAPDEYSYIDGMAPIKHIRHEARSLLGDKVAIDNDSAREIWDNIQRAGHKKIGTSLFLSPNDLIVHIAVVVEI